MGSASSTATGATLPSFGRFVYTRIPTATQDAPQRIEEGQEVRLKHLLPVLTEADPGVQGGVRHHRQRQGRNHHRPRLKRHLRELDGQSAMARPTTWLERPQDQSTSPRWSHSLLKRCPEVPMTMTSSSGHSKPSKSTDRLTPKCSGTL